VQFRRGSVVVALMLVLSAACGGEEEVALGRTVDTISSAGLEREYVLHVPRSYDAGTPTPLIVVFHGYTMTAAQQEVESQLATLGEEENFITVFPEGRGDHNRRWLFELDSEDLDIATANPDIAFVSDLLDSLANDLNVDPDRIYAAGFSNGGWMASAVACTMPERVAAVAPVAGIMDFGSECERSEPVPMIAFHGTNDRYEPFEGGADNAPRRWSLPTDVGGTFGQLPVSGNPMLDVNVPDKVTLWAQANGCESEPTTTEHAGTSTEWTFSCPPDASVVLYEIPDGTHNWDLGTGFDTNQALWTFFDLTAK
jgi:polyhydroxybutyrate depolymerase